MPAAPQLSNTVSCKGTGDNIGFVAKYDTSGTPQWIICRGKYFYSPVIAAAGALFAGDADGFFKLSPTDGSQVWLTNTSGAPSYSAVYNDAVYAGSSLILTGRTTGAIFGMAAPTHVGTNGWAAYVAIMNPGTGLVSKVIYPLVSSVADTGNHVDSDSNGNLWIVGEADGTSSLTSGTSVANTGIKSVNDGWWLELKSDLTPFNV